MEEFLHCTELVFFEEWLKVYIFIFVDVSSKSILLLLWNHYGEKEHRVHTK